jgi:hypothetical protein
MLYLPPWNIRNTDYTPACITWIVDFLSSKVQDNKLNDANCKPTKCRVVIGTSQNMSPLECKVVEQCRHQRPASLHVWVIQASAHQSRVLMRSNRKRHRIWACDWLARLEIIHRDGFPTDGSERNLCMVSISINTQDVAINVERPDCFDQKVSTIVRASVCVKRIHNIVLLYPTLLQSGSDIANSMGTNFARCLLGSQITG